MTIFFSNFWYNKIRSFKSFLDYVSIYVFIGRLGDFISSITSSKLSLFSFNSDKTASLQHAADIPNEKWLPQFPPAPEINIIFLLI